MRLQGGQGTGRSSLLAGCIQLEVINLDNRDESVEVQEPGEGKRS